MAPTIGGHSWLHNITPYLIFLVAVTTIGPLQFGYHLGELNAPKAVITCEKKAINANKASLPQCIPMTEAEFGLVSSIFTLGGLVGALIAGTVSAKHGRLFAMRVTAIFLTLGPVFETLALKIATMSLGRFLSGIGAGASLVVVPVYISEIAPPQDRGVFGALTQVMINLGIVISQLLGLFLSHDSYWRIILAVSGAIGLLQLIALVGVAESPLWISAQGRPQDAKKVLRSIRGNKTDLSNEIEAWAHSAGPPEHDEQAALISPAAAAAEADPERDEAATGKQTHAKHEHVGVFEILRIPLYRSAIIAVVGVMLAQQLIGINSIVMYSVYLLSDLLPTTSALLTVVVSSLNLVITIFCAPLSDRLGRKPCLLLSIAGMGSSAFVLAISIALSLKVLSAIAVLLFVSSFAVGLGPVPFILASELVGQEAVGAAQSWALAANWTATFAVAQFFPMVNQWLGKGRVYFLFAGFAVGFFAFVAWCVPETKGKKSVDEVWGRERRVD